MSHIMRLNAPFCIVLISICVSLCKGYAQKIEKSSVKTKKGVWVPLTAINHETAILKLQTSQSDHLYAFGSGKSFIYSALQQNTEPTWKELFPYAPQLTWTEGEKIEASGLFNEYILEQVESEVSTLIEDMVDQQQDETFLSEDTAQSLIENYLTEAYPAITSPYFLHQTQAHKKDGVLVQSGAGLWHISAQKLYQISPTIEIHSMTHNSEWIWVSNSQGIFFKSLSQLDKSAWQKLSDHANALLACDTHILWFTHQQHLYRSHEFASPKVNVRLPETINTLFYHRKHLWAMGTSTLYALNLDQAPSSINGKEQSMASSMAWQRCMRYPYKPHTLKVVSSTHILAIFDHQLYLTQLSPTYACTYTQHFSTGNNQALTFYDAAQHRDQIYVATQQGIFIWHDNISRHSLGIKYYQKALQTYPRFDQIYRTALKTQQLDPQANNYGMRPLLSALLPQVRLRFQTHPQRSDSVPTFSDGSRQLTLHQPRFEYQIYLEWRLSFDFLATLVDPSRASTIVDLQNQMQNSIDQPGSNVVLEDALDVNVNEMDQDTYSTQAQRLAMTTIAVEKRQMQKDRVVLYRSIKRLYQERFTILYRLLMENKSSAEQKSSLQLRIQEIDALLDAMTHHRLSISDLVASSLTQSKIK
jgi:hypothetical protein